MRDLVGHLGTWLAEAAQQFEQMLAGTYGGHDIDIDALNATFLAAMQGQPWDVAWTQANAGRTRMRQAWADLPGPNDEAAWWIRKSAVEHYAAARAAPARVGRRARRGARPEPASARARPCTEAAIRRRPRAPSSADSMPSSKSV